jgi:hypothetical protein
MRHGGHGEERDASGTREEAEEDAPDGGERVHAGL